MGCLIFPLGVATHWEELVSSAKSGDVKEDGHNGQSFYVLQVRAKKFIRDNVSGKFKCNFMFQGKQKLKKKHFTSVVYQGIT